MISPAGVDLIVAHEGCPPRPYWPGGASGVTLGVGYDLGHHSAEELQEDWIEPGRISIPDLATEHALLRCVGKRGGAAAALVSTVRGCRIEEADAREVFEERSVPKYEAQTRAAFPGVEALPLDAYSALVSLVFNRGPGMGNPNNPDDWDRRREMREIRDLVPTGDLAGIAAAIRSMKRLWEGKNLDGLLRRREDEAKLVERVA